MGLNAEAIAHLTDTYKYENASIFGNGLYWDRDKGQYMKKGLISSSPVGIRGLTYEQAQLQDPGLTHDNYIKSKGGSDIGKGSMSTLDVTQVGLGLAGLAATIDSQKFNERMARKNYELQKDELDVKKADMGYRADGTTNKSRTQRSLAGAFA